MNRADVVRSDSSVYIERLQIAISCQGRPSSDHEVKNHDCSDYRGRASLLCKHWLGAVCRTSGSAKCLRTGTTANARRDAPRDARNASWNAGPAVNARNASWHAPRHDRDATGNAARDAPWHGWHASGGSSTGELSATFGSRWTATKLPTAAAATNRLPAFRLDRVRRIGRMRHLRLC